MTTRWTSHGPAHPRRYVMLFFAAKMLATGANGHTADAVSLFVRSGCHGPGLGEREPTRVPVGPLRHGTRIGAAPGRGGGGPRARSLRIIRHGCQSCPPSSMLARSTASLADSRQNLVTPNLGSSSTGVTTVTMTNAVPLESPRRHDR